MNANFNEHYIEFEKKKVSKILPYFFKFGYDK